MSLMSSISYVWVMWFNASVYLCNIHVAFCYFHKIWSRNATSFNDHVAVISLFNSFMHAYTSKLKISEVRFRRVRLASCHEAVFRPQSRKCLAGGPTISGVCASINIRNTLRHLFFLISPSLSSYFTFCSYCFLRTTVMRNDVRTAEPVRQVLQTKDIGVYAFLGSAVTIARAVSQYQIQCAICTIKSLY